MGTAASAVPPWWGEWGDRSEGEGGAEGDACTSVAGPRAVFHGSWCLCVCVWPGAVQSPWDRRGPSEGTLSQL